MSEMPIAASGRKIAVTPISRTSPPRVDLTPMVDLGFLLLSFFIFTTTLATPLSKTLVLPASKGPNTPPTPLPESRTITLLPAGNDTVQYYEGIFTSGKTVMHTVTVTEIRRVLMQKQELTKARGGIIAVIQPDSSCAYGLLVNLLDELTIMGCNKYFLTDTN
ncbi:MAG: biopolymer transporter ExbD [Chitinophagia bacterium]|jgi:biopolymer transport protein ExbD